MSADIVFQGIVRGTAKKASETTQTGLSPEAVGKLERAVRHANPALPGAAGQGRITGRVLPLCTGRRRVTTLIQEPGAAFCFVNIDFDQAGRGDVVLFLDHAVCLTHAPG